jgi:RsiW-degrading membrane proteinase PrsW (M82 family)
MSTSLPSNTESQEETKSFFDNFYSTQVTFPSSQIDAVVGYFLKRGFPEESAKSTAIVLLNQARIEKVEVFKLIDTLQGLTDVQLSSIVTEILNTTRDRTSSLGFKVLNSEETLDSRNVRP